MNCACGSEHEKFLNLSLFSARSICNKLPELHSLLYHESRHVILITETWLNDNIPNRLLDPQFHIFWCDRKEWCNGGICVLIPRDLPVNAHNVPVSDSYPDAELLCVDITYRNAKCCMVVLYRSTDTTQQLEMCTKQIVQCLEDLARINYPCFIMADINAPTIDWINLVMLENCSDMHLLEFAIDSGFTQMVRDVTRQNIVLDVILTNEPNTMYDVSVCTLTGRSDHCRVNFTVVLELDSLDSVPNIVHNTSHTARKCYRWSGAGYDGMANHLANYDWSHMFSVNLTVEAMWSAFTDILYSVIDISVPTSTAAPCKYRKLYPKNVVKPWHVSAAYGVNTACTQIMPIFYRNIKRQSNNVGKLCISMNC